MVTTLMATDPLLGKTNPTATMHRASAFWSSGQVTQSGPRYALRQDACESCPHR
jgi:hypothetical protein